MRCTLVLCFPGLQIEGVLAYFTQLRRQKRIGNDVGDLKYDFTNTFLLLLVKMTPLILLSNLLCKNMTPNALKCILLPFITFITFYYLKCILDTLKVSKIC
jgi:hypothetical protein